MSETEWAAVADIAPIANHEIANRGHLYHVRLTRDVPLDGFLGKRVRINDQPYTVIGVEAPAISRTAYYAGEVIGILVRGSDE